MVTRDAPNRIGQVVGNDQRAFGVHRHPHWTPTGLAVVAAEAGGAEAPVDIQQQDKLGGWEIHYLVPSEFGGVAIKTSHGEEWVRGLGGANVPCNVSTCLNTWETWEFIQVGPNVYNIRNKFHGAYLRGHPGGEGAKVDNSSMADTWERWSIQPAQ